MSAPEHLRHGGWVIVPDYSTPYVGHTWTAYSVDYEKGLAAATYEDLLVEIAEFEAEIDA